MTREVKIEKFIIGGINHPRVSIKGYKKNNINLIALVDDKEYNLEEDIELGRDFALSLLDSNEYSNFAYFKNIPNTAKKVEIYQITNKIKKLLAVKKTNVYFRLANRILYEIQTIPHRLKRLLIILKKTFYVLKKNHFILSKDKLKHYLKSVKNNSNVNSMDEYFYNPLNQKEYLKWLKENEQALKIEKLKYNPLISVVVPVYNVERKYLVECIDSVLNQIYNNFELVLVDDCSTNEETVKVLKEYENNEKVKVIYREKNGHISEATNTGIKASKGEFISLLDNDDTLSLDALYYVALALNKNRKLDMIYSDEDKIYFNGKYYFPHFKPDFSPDTLLSSNYICHFTTLRKNIINKIGGFRSEYNGSQDYDMFLRYSENTTNIYHIPKILYHWRMIPSSTAASGSSKNYAYLAGQKALEDTMKRRKIDAKVNLVGTPQTYDIEYGYKKEPKISIIIPTKDKSKLLEACLKSIYKNTEYKNFEIIVVSNNSNEEETFKLLKQYKEKYSNFNYFELNTEFNFSYINNEAVKRTKGEYIVFLNNDIEIISKNWLSKMVGYASQKHIGCVGIKLLYPNLTVQHGGVVLGGGGVAAHAFIDAPDDDFGYFGRLIETYDVGAVTAACLMIKASKFDEVKGFDEKLKVAYNDVDLNIKILEKGYYNVLIPSLKAFHHESVSRGNDFDDDKKKRFTEEITYITKKWKDKLLNDKFYNNNMSYYYPFHLDKKK